MGKPDVEYKLLALLCGAVTDAVDFKLFFIAVGNAFDHVGDQRARQPVQGARLIALVLARHVDDGSVNSHRNARRNFFAQRRLGALDGHGVVAADRHRNACGNVDWQFTDS